MGAYESGLSFLTGVFPSLPEATRAQVQAALESAEARSFITTIGDGVLARSDYSKHMDTLKTQTDDLTKKQQALDQLYQQNLSWYETNKPVLDEYTRIKPEYDVLKAGDSGDPSHRPAPAAFDAEQARKIAQEQINAVAPDMVGVAAWSAAKAVEHYAQFGEVLPLSELVTTTLSARQAGRSLTLDEAYREKYGERVQQKAKEAEDARINKLVQDRLAEERAKAGPMPFPLRTEASVLDVLGAKPDPASFGVDAAVAEYQRLQAARGGA